MSIYIRVDGGDIYGIAMGHVYRCIKMARLLKKTFGIKPIFIMKDYKEGVNKVSEHSFEVRLIDRNCSIEKDIEITSCQAEGKCLICDVRHFGKNEFEYLKKKTKPFVVFDDFSNRQIFADVVINPSIAPRHRHYERSNGTRYFMGPRYFLTGMVSRPRIALDKDVKDIIVSLGGSDPARYTEELAKKIHVLCPVYNFTFVLGPGYGRVSYFRRLLDSLNFSADIIYDVKDLPSLIAKMDLAIVAGGDTCMEVAYLGVPGMIVPTIKHEEETAEYLQRRKALVNLGDIKRKKEEEIIRQISNFANDFSKRKIFSENARNMINNKGSERIASLLLKVMS